MTPTYPHLSTSRLLLGGLLALGSVTPAFAGTNDWVSYTDETATRLVVEATLGINDPEEKDYVIGDVDQDGDTDLIVLRKLPFSVAGPRRNVLLMNEDGVLTDRTNVLAPDFLTATDDRDGILVDVDSDGWQDLVTAGTFGEQPRVIMNLGDDVGGLWRGFDFDATANRLPTYTFPKFCSVAAGDVSGDNKPDLFFTDYENTVEDRLLINNGSGVFTDETATRMTPAMSASVFGNDSSIADLNGDGFNDIIKNNSSGDVPPPGTFPRVSALYNDGTGHFTVMDDIYTEAPYMSEVVDFTQDGKLDVFVVDDAQDKFMVNTGNNGQGRAQFITQNVSTSPSTSFFGGSLRMVDLDLDGILDAIIADVDTDIPGCQGQLALLRGLGTPPNITYGDPLAGASRPWLPNGTFDAAPIDINSDGALDLVIGTCTGTHVFMAANPPLFADGFETGTTGRWDSAFP